MRVAPAGLSKPLALTAAPPFLRRRFNCAARSLPPVLAGFEQDHVVLWSSDREI